VIAKAIRSNNMTLPASSDFPAAQADLVRFSLGEAREASGRLLEAVRQTLELINQSAGAVASGAREFNGKAVQQAEEHLQLSFSLAERLIEAKDVKDAIGVHRDFARQTAEAYGRHIRELSHLMAQLTQPPSHLADKP
jgi:hypothetical protein